MQSDWLHKKLQRETFASTPDTKQKWTRLANTQGVVVAVVVGRGGGYFKAFW